MTSPVKLPPLPPMLATIATWKNLLLDEPNIDIYSAQQLRAYAEQAVREALAAQEPVAYLNSEALDRLQKPYVAGCAAALEKTPRGGFVAIAIIPDADKAPPC